MTSFESDYDNGILPEILNRLSETNNEKTTGYGYDSFCEQAKEKIKKACLIDKADIFFLTGGTQANSTVIDALCQGYEGVISAENGHISVHESGAIEAFGHKVITLKGNKLAAKSIDQYMTTFTADETSPHMVQPRMVYLTFPTELGLLYSKDELAEIYNVCKKHNLYLYVDGARLGYGLASYENDISLPFLAGHCDVFYIGGTKVGAMFGEAIVFSNINAPKHFFTIVKRHGALLAKGRMLGIQFSVLFTDDLYMRISQNAIEKAEQMKNLFAAYGYTMPVPSPTNQQFVVLTPQQRLTLSEDITFGGWEKTDDGGFLCRFVTSWATTDEDIIALEKALSRLSSTHNLHR